MSLRLSNQVLGNTVCIHVPRILFSTGRGARPFFRQLISGTNHMRRIATAVFCLLIGLMGGCAPEQQDQDSGATPTYTIGGSVTGLTAGTVVLQNNSGDDLLIHQSGSGDVSFSFPTKISSGTSYSVTVLIQPNTQTCTVNSGSGAVSGTVSSVRIVCSSESYSIGGSISGISGTAVLQNNGVDDLTLIQNGSFTFSTKVAKGAAYHVTVKTQPFPYTCTASSNRGIVGADVSDVSVNCSIHTYLLSGTASGLGSTTLTLQHGGESQSITDNGSDNASFSFSTPVAEGGGYSITIPSQPDNRTCTVVNGARDNSTAHYSDLRAACWSYIDNVSSGGLNDNNSRDATAPTAANYNNRLYTAWVESNGTKNVIRAKRYDNSSWSAIDYNTSTSSNGIISSSGENASQPHILLESNQSVLYLVWIDQKSGVNSLWFAYNIASSTDNALAQKWFLIDKLNYSSTDNASTPYGTTSGGKLYVIWSELNSSNVSQIRIRNIKDIATINAWVDGGGTTGINDNTSHNATNPELVVNSSSVFYAAWSETNTDGVNQIRVKKLDRGTNTDNTTWVSVDGDNRTHGINANYLYAADQPNLAFFNSRLYASWQEANADNKTQVRVAVYDDNLTITDNGTQLILDNLTGSGKIGLSRSNCSLDNLSDTQTSVYANLGSTTQNNRSYYFSTLNNVTLTNAVIYNSTISSSSISNSTIFNSTVKDNSSLDNVTLYKSTLSDNTSATGSKLYSSTLDNSSSYDANSVIDNSTDVSGYTDNVTLPDLNSACWVYVDGGSSSAGLNGIVDADGNENATEPKMLVSGSKLYLSWLQHRGSATQARIALYNDNDSSPSWQTVDRYDEYGPSRFGLNYNTLQSASGAVPATANSKLYMVWSEPDNSSGKSQVRVVENPF